MSTSGRSQGSRSVLRKAAIWIGASLVVVGCAGVENSLLYQPAPGPEPYEAPPAPFQEVQLEIPDGTKIHARLAPHPRAKGAILYCHGNGGNIELWGRAAHELWQALEESILIFDYPGYGYSGGKPSEQGCYDAADAAYQWLVQKQYVTPEKIILCGESLGGAVAVDLASRRPHRALVLIRTFTSMPDVADDQIPILPGSLIMTNRFDSLAKIPSCHRPVFIAHADRDRLLPLRQGQRLYNACSGPAEFCLLRNMGHNDPLPPDFYAALRRFMNQHENQ
jgi:pimeloyl-ACP methyl ester carboxylesterase